MSSSLRDDLASLKIERQNHREVAPAKRAGRGASIRFLGALLWLIPLGLLAGAGTYVYQQYDQFRPRPEVTVGLVQAMTVGEAETLLSAKGYIKSHNQAMIGAKMPGRVEQMLVEEGTRVQKGQLLAVLEHQDLVAQLDSRMAMQARTKAELAESRADFQLKDLKVRRRAQLQARGTITGEEVEQYSSDRDMAQARVQALEAMMKAQQAQVAEIQSLIDNMHIYAPFAGTVTEKAAEVGETITPGGMGAASGRGSVVTLADLEYLEVETDIAENLLSRIRVGQPAEVTVSAVPDRRYKGRLDRIIPMGDRTRGTVKVDVRVLDPDDRLFPELVATVHFLPDESLDNPNAGRTFIFAPKIAIIEEAGHSYVWTLGAQESLRKQLVEVVVTNDELARVEKGLEAGQQVVLNPAKTLREGQLVKIAQ